MQRQHGSYWPRLAFLLLPLTLAAALGSTMLHGCGDDFVDCFPLCPANFVCAAGNDGSSVCLPRCGNTVCTESQSCENNVCVGGASVTCGPGEHAVSNVCVPNYTTSNVCDPWRECRSECGTNLTCLQACESDRSSSCATCASTLSSCESRNNCTSGAYVENCCFDAFCDCYPSHPNCGNVPPCDECDEECGNDAACLNRCIQGEPACAECLGPYFECRDSGGANCNALAASCSSN